MRKAWIWLREHASAALGALASVLLVVLGAGWLWRRQKSRLGKVRDELAVQKATAEIGKLTALREELKRRVGEKDEQVEYVDQKLAENRRAIVEAHEHGAGLTDAEVADEFARLGY